jgi:hypothetical protein
MTKKAMTVEQFEAEVARMDKNLKRSDPAFKSAVLLLASTQVGARVKALQDFTAYPRAFIEARAHNLLKSNVWTKDGCVRHSGWFDKRDGGVAFWLDVAVAEGFIARTGA